MLNFPQLEPVAQAEVLCALLRNASPHGSDASRVVEIATRIAYRDGEQPLVMPKPSTLGASFPGGEDWPLDARALACFMQLCTHTVHANGFEIEDNLADRSLQMSHAQKFMRLIERTTSAYRRLEAEMPGGFLVIPWRIHETCIGLSPFDSRDRICQAEDEFPLDPIAVLSWCFTHHEALGNEILWLDALGSEISPKGDGRYDDTPYIDRRGRKVCNVDWNWGKRKRGFRMATSGRIP